MARVMWVACAAVASRLAVAHADFTLDTYGDVDGKVTTTGTRICSARRTVFLKTSSYIFAVARSGCSGLP